MALSPISVLVIDDSDIFLHIAQLVLRLERGLDVVGAFADAREALARVEELAPDVALVDLAMPGVCGLEAIPRIREIAPRTGIIALTLLDADAYRKAALAAGADELVSKTALDT